MKKDCWEKQELQDQREVVDIWEVLEASVPPGQLAHQDPVGQQARQDMPDNPVQPDQVEQQVQMVQPDQVEQREEPVRRE